jgi:hypothetical protein
MDIIGASHPFFKPPVRRYVLVATCLIWTILEWSFNQPFWGLISLGLFCLAAYELILTYDKRHGNKSANEDTNKDAKP